MNKPLGLYFHIPFCRSKCTYCDFYSYIARPEVHSRYVDALVRTAEKLRPLAAEYRVDTVYFGGGTPSVLDAAEFGRVMSAVRAFSPADGAEITAEANPAPLDPALLRAWQAEGVNRVSMGMQSAVDGELKLIGRRHRNADIADAVRAVRDAGIENISLDLMLGLPGQTAESAKISLETALSLRPTHLSVYCLKLEEGTALAKMVETGRVTLPDDDAIAELYLSCAARLAAEGFEHYEISNFALPGCRSRHNMRYWQRSDYLGIGAAAHSFFGGTRRYFPADTAAFLDLADGSAIGWETDDPADPTEETLILALRTADGLDLAAFSALAGEATAEQIGEALEKFTKSGHARRTAQGYALTAEGWLVSNAILSDLLLLL